MSNPIRVLQVVTHMNRGGLETMLMNYYRNIDRTKVQFDFLTHRTEKKDYDDEILSMGGKIYHLPELNPFSLSYRKALDNFFKENKEYKIVHSHLDCMSALPLHYAKKIGVPVRIAHSHNTSQENNLKYIIKLIYKRKMPREATGLWACGQEAGTWMFNGREFQILNNAIDSKKFDYNQNTRNVLRKEMGLEDKFVLGHVGRFNKQKNHELLIDIFKEYSTKNEKAILLLIGEGDLKEEIKDKVIKLGLSDRVQFLGNRSDVNELLQVMDVFVFPSLFEGLPLTLIEAQAAGLDCVVSDTITKELDLTGNVQYCSINDDVKKWCEKIVQAEKFNRESQYENICKGHFDIIENAEWLQEYYLRKI